MSSLYGITEKLRCYCSKAHVLIEKLLVASNGYFILNVEATYTPLLNHLKHATTDVSVWRVEAHPFMLETPKVLREILDD